MSTIQLIVLALVFGVLIHELSKIRKQLFSIEFRLKDKVDKPTEFERFMEERKKQPKLTREELDKIMSPEEKEYWKKLNGTGYPNGIDS